MGDIYCYILIGISALVSYLLGSINTAIIVSKNLSGDDIRDMGSGNAGMTNVMRNYGKKAGIYTLLGDGEIQEGQVWEAAMFAGHRNLDNLCVIVDNNGLQIDGNIADVCSPYPIDKKFEAFNFHVINVDAHDFDALRAAFKEARETKGMPTYF